MKLRDANIISLDTETTGLDTEKDRICEVGWCRLRYQSDGTFKAGDGHSQIINPGIPIPPEASAIHHLTDNSVSGEPNIESWPKQFKVDLVVAHNAEFDKAFCIREGVITESVLWLCTMRLAKHLLPNAPGYKNQVLRYFLGFENIPGDPHRADHDAAVTAAIFSYMLNYCASPTATIKELIELAESPVLLTGKMGFGKHGKLTWQECLRKDRGYLQWMAKQGAQSPGNPDGWDRDQWFTVNELLNGRGQNVDEATG